MYKYFKDINHLFWHLLFILATLGFVCLCYVSDWFMIPAAVTTFCALKLRLWQWHWESDIMIESSRFEREANHRFAEQAEKIRLDGLKIFTETINETKCPPHPPE